MTEDPTSPTRMPGLNTAASVPLTIAVEQLRDLRNQLADWRTAREAADIAFDTVRDLNLGIRDDTPTFEMRRRIDAQLLLLHQMYSNFAIGSTLLDELLQTLLPLS